MNKKFVIIRMNKKFVIIAATMTLLAIGYLLDHLVYLDTYQTPILFTWLGLTSILGVRTLMEEEEEIGAQPAESLNIEEIMRQAAIPTPTPEPPKAEPQISPLGVQLANYILQKISEGYELKAVIESLTQKYPANMIYEIVNILTMQGQIKAELPSIEMPKPIKPGVAERMAAMRAAKKSKAPAQEVKT